MTIKLTYFPIKGRAEATRLALTIGGIEFEDIRINFEQWKEMKSQTKYGELPILEKDGEVLSESLAQFRWAGKAAGLYPDDDWKAALVDEAVFRTNAVTERFGPSFSEKDPEKKLAMRKAVLEGPMTKLLDYNEKQLAASGYLVGDKLTMADVLFYVVISAWQSGILDGIPTTLLDTYPNIKAHETRIAEHPKVKAWNDAHPPPQKN